MSTDKLYRGATDDTEEQSPIAYGTPGKLPATARLTGGPRFIFRVESAEAAHALAGAFGSRDGNGVAQGAEVAVDRAASSAGSALPADLRSRFESSLGADLSSVRVHTGDTSAESASAVGAKAYTTGNDIHFGAGHYDPSSAFGVHLLAHEVAHTVQQQGGPPTRQHKLEVSAPQDAAEVEADRAADAMVTGAAAEVTSAAGVSRQVIQRADGKTTDVKTDKEVEVDLGGKKIKVNASSPEASFEMEAQKYPTEGGEISRTFPVALCPGVFGYLYLGGSAGVTMSSKVSVKGTKTGAEDDPTWTFSVGGNLSVKGELKVVVSLGIAAGVPGILALRAEAAAMPTASIEATTGVTGSVAYTKGSPAKASAEFPIDAKAELSTEFAMRALYDVPWKKNPVEFGKFTFAKWVIATGGYSVTPKYGAAGWSTTGVKPYINWGEPPAAQQIGGVPIAEQIAYYEEFGPGGDGGGSGNDAVSPDELDENGEWRPPPQPVEDDRALPDDGGGHPVVVPEGEDGECVAPNAPPVEAAEPEPEPEECVDPGMSQ